MGTDDRIVDLTKYRLSADKVTWVADPSEFSFKSTAELPPPAHPMDAIIGQQAAKDELLSAIRLRENAILIGPAGTGKSMLAKAVADEYVNTQQDKLQLTDQLLVHNFDNPFEPDVLVLPTPMGREFRNDLKAFVRMLPKSGTYIVPNCALDPSQYTITLAKPGFFSTKVYTASLADLVDIAERQLKPKYTAQKIPGALDRLAKSREPMNEPVLEVNGNPVTLRALYGDFATVTQDKTKEKLDSLVEKYKGNQQVTRFFANVARDVVENSDLFQKSMFQQQDPLAGMRRRRFEANLIVDNADTKGLPVQYIENPSIQNIMGEAGHDAFNETPPHVRVKAGKLHQANKGIVVIDELITLLQDQFMRNYVLTILQEKKARIGGGWGLMGGGTSAGIESKPVEADCIVIGCANEDILGILQQSPKLNRRFSHKVLFQPHMPNTPENRQGYALFVAQEVNKYNADPSHLQKIPHFAPDGVAAMIELGIRYVQLQNVHGKDNLTNVLAPLASIVHRAGLEAIDGDSGLVGRAQVYGAIQKARRVGDQIKEEVFRAYRQNLRTVEVDGWRTGVINGLGVMRDQIGLLSFGAPMRVEATASPGKGIVHDIDLESKLGDETQAKRFGTVQALLKHRYGGLLNAADIYISHPQVYQKTGGDSDSLCVFQAIRSALSGFPVNQSLFTTGSLNQHGEIQPIGGICEKCEGGHEACTVHGALTGRQGIVMPYQNVIDLMLAPNVALDVDQGRFHIMPVRTLDDADELHFGRSTKEIDDAVMVTLKQYASEMARKRN